jgi:hypothetical protein
MSALGLLSGVVLECRDPSGLAAFYSRLTEWPVTFADEDWCSIGESADAEFHLSFQRSAGHLPPESARVFADPAGHPFCLVRPGSA